MRTSRTGESLKGWLTDWWGATDAATAVEYSIMAGFIAAVIIVAAVFLGQEAQGTYDCTKESIESSDSRC